MMGFPADAIAPHATATLMLLAPAMAVGAIAMTALAMAKSASPVSARAARVDIAVGIVRERLARGEIDESEYERLVRGLTRTA